MSTSAAYGPNSAAKPSRPFATSAIRFALRERCPELVWGLFAAANLGFMLAMPDWQTVPFHLVWVSLTVLYGYRLWTPRATILLLVAVGFATAAVLAASGDLSTQRLNELAEVPLMAAMFLVMVWHARRRQEALRQVRKAAERERDFVRDASHQLRTPITVAIGHAELIRSANPGTQTERDAAVVLEELRRLARTSKRLLVLAASEHPEFLMLQPVDLDELMHSAASRWGAIPERRWRFYLSAHGSLLADRERVDCALDALIENAITATGGGDGIAVEAYANGSDAVFAVSDNGRGIPAEQIGRIFDRFARLPDRGGRRNGTGLGLPMVKAIVEAHDGTVSVSSEVGRGATFRMRFAAFTPAASSPARVGRVGA